MPRLFIISGCNGSGKTTASYTLLPEMLDCREFVNSDEFAKGLSPFSPESASVAASRYMLTKIRYLFDRKADFCIETTLAARTLINTVKEAQQDGYYVTILYLWLESADLAVARVRARVEAGGHNIKETTIRRRYSLGLHYFLRKFVPLCDRWILADNSLSQMEIIAEGSENGVKINNPDKLARIQAMNAEYEKTLANKKFNDRK